MKDEKLLIDFHTHILPGADHGSSGIDETKKQLSLVRKYGVETIVATPHFYPDKHNVDRFIEKIGKCIELIKQIPLSERPRICIGAEVLLCEGLDEMPGLENLCIRGTKCLLLEMPLTEWREEQLETVISIIAKGYTVVLAHIDRYNKKYPRGIEFLLDSGAVAQINGEALASFIEFEALMPYVRAKCVAAIGSDLHGSNEKTYKCFIKACKSLKGNCAYIMQETEKLLENAVRY